MMSSCSQKEAPKSNHRRWYDREYLSQPATTSTASHARDRSEAKHTRTKEKREEADTKPKKIIITLPKLKKMVHMVMLRYYRNEFYEKKDLVDKVMYKLNMKNKQQERTKVRNLVNKWIEINADGETQESTSGDSKKGIFKKVDCKKAVAATIAENENKKASVTIVKDFEIMEQEEDNNTKKVATDNLAPLEEKVVNEPKNQGSADKQVTNELKNQVSTVKLVTEEQKNQISTDAPVTNEQKNQGSTEVPKVVEPNNQGSAEKVTENNELNNNEKRSSSPLKLSENITIEVLTELIIKNKDKIDISFLKQGIKDEEKEKQAPICCSKCKEPLLIDLTEEDVKTEIKTEAVAENPPVTVPAPVESNLTQEEINQREQTQLYNQWAWYHYHQQWYQQQYQQYQQWQQQNYLQNWHAQQRTYDK